MRIGSITTDIIADGLVFNADAANRASYIPNAAIAYNTKEGSNNMQLNNGVTPSTGSIKSWKLDGVDIQIEIDGLEYMPSNTTVSTYEMWCKRNDASGIEYFWDFRPGGGTYFICNYNGYDYNWSDTCQFNDSDSFTSWTQIVAIKDNDVSLLYRNGELKATAGNIDGDFGNNAKIGSNNTATGFFWDGQIASFRAYNRALSATEVLHNYNALKGRFGL